MYRIWFAAIVGALCARDRIRRRARAWDSLKSAQKGNTKAAQWASQGTRRLTFGQGRQHEQVDGDRGPLRAHKRNVVRRAAERLYVVSYPVQSGHLVH